MIDITRTEEKRSVGAKLEALLVNALKYDLEDLKEEVKIILLDDTYVSVQKANTYINDMNRIYTLSRMRAFITNIYLAAANMPVNKRKK